ncbi:MAG: hypothetical protein NT169_23055 [Chloroflexi bacterium]|nr:hypothetical protein [Chloroflexota bacterium]
MTPHERWWISHIVAAVCGVTVGTGVLLRLASAVYWPFYFGPSKATLIQWQALLASGILAGGLGNSLIYVVAQKFLRLRIEGRALLWWMGLGALLWPLPLALGISALLLTWPFYCFIPDIVIPGWGLFEDGPLIAACLIGDLLTGIITGSVLAFLRVKTRRTYIGWGE